MNQSEQINELAAALSKAQGKITPAIKDSTNPFFKSKYADLSSVWDACKTALTENGLAVMQTTDYKDGQMVLLTTLAHSSGQWIRSCIPINPTKNDAQGIGSAITYMRRYSLASIVGVTTDEDDDGNAASLPNANRNSSFGSGSKISQSSAKELEDMLKSCPTDFQKNFWNYMKSEVKGIEKMDQLPEGMYLRIKSSISKKLKELASEVTYA